MKTLSTQRDYYLSLERERSTKLVSTGICRAGRQFDRVKSKTERSLNARTKRLRIAKGQNTRVVDLGLDEGSVVEVRLRADLKVHVARGLRVIRGTSTSLNVLVHSVVVRSAVRGEVAQRVECDGILRSVEASGQVVTRKLLVLCVVRGLSTEQEAITANHSISSKQRTLKNVHKVAHVQAWRSVGQSQESVLGLLLWHKRRNGLELQALSEMVLGLNVVAQHIGGRPGLCEGKTLLAVLPAGLKVTANVRRLVVLQTQHTECHTRWRAGLDLKGRAMDGVVLAKDIRRGLTKVLPARWHRDRHGVLVQWVNAEVERE